MLVSGKLALQANSDKHLTESWKESIIIGKCLLYRSSETQYTEVLSQAGPLTLHSCAQSIVYENKKQFYTESF